jgi:sirohydrochlorin ferrochelatase
MVFEQSVNTVPPLSASPSGRGAFEDAFEDEDEEDQGTCASEESVCILVDNGSSRAASTLSLRNVAQRLQQRIGTRVVATSLKHSDKAPVSELGGEPAVLFEAALRALKSDGAGLSGIGVLFEDQTSVRQACVLPVFFGPSAALAALVPPTLDGSGDSVHVQVRLARHLGAGSEGVRMIANAMMREVRSVIHHNKLVKPPVILVDHGSPSRDVVALRDAVAAELRREAVDAGLAASVQAASMERKPGDEYAFADPLLDAALRDLVATQRQSAGSDSDIDVVLCMMFLGPGTHAGEGGDIDRICAAVGGVRVHRTRLFGQCEGLVDILETRYREAVGA